MKNHFHTILLILGTSLVARYTAIAQSYNNDKIKTQLGLNRSYLMFKGGDASDAKSVQMGYENAMLYALLGNDDSALSHLKRVYEYSGDIEHTNDYCFDVYKNQPEWQEVQDQQLDKYQEANKHLEQLELAIKIIVLSGRGQSISACEKYLKDKDEKLSANYTDLKKQEHNLLKSIAKKDYPGLGDIGANGLKCLNALVLNEPDTELQKALLAKMKKTVQKKPANAQYLNQDIAYLEDKIK